MKRITLLIAFSAVAVVSLYSQIDVSALRHDADIPFSADVGTVFTLPAEEKGKEIMLFSSGAQLYQCIVDINGGGGGLVSKIDLEPIRLKSVSDVHPLNRFADEWIVLFVGSDGEGNRALYAMKPRISPEKAEFARLCAMGKETIDTPYKALNADFANYVVLVETQNDLMLVDVRKKLGYDSIETVSMSRLFGFKSMLPKKTAYRYLPASETISIVLLADDGSGMACHDISMKGSKSMGHEVVGKDVSDFLAFDPESQDSAYESMSVSEVGHTSLYMKKEGIWAKAYETPADVLFAWAIGGDSGLSLVVEQDPDGDARYLLVDSMRNLTTVLHEEAGVFLEKNGFTVDISATDDVMEIALTGKTISSPEEEVGARFAMISSGQVAFNGCTRSIREGGPAVGIEQRIDGFLSQMRTIDGNLFIQNGKSQAKDRIFRVGNKIINVYSAK